MVTAQDRAFMLRALALAHEAAKSAEVPVGAVIVKDGKIIGEGRNKREQEQSALLHAEMEAIAQACRTIGSWRLSGCEMYVTLEPCAMCAGAIINARLERVIFGAYDENAGACISAVDLFHSPLSGNVQIIGGYMQQESAAILQQFFSHRRTDKNKV